MSSYIKVYHLIEKKQLILGTTFIGRKIFTRRTPTSTSTSFEHRLWTASRSKTHWQVPSVVSAINVTRRSKHRDADWPVTLAIGSFARKQGDFARENHIRLEIVYRRDFSEQLLPTSTLLLLLRESIFASRARGCTHRDAKCLASLYFFFVFIEISLTAVISTEKKEKRKKRKRKKNSIVTEHDSRERNSKRQSTVVFEKGKNSSQCDTKIGKNNKLYILLMDYKMNKKHDIAFYTEMLSAVAIRYW